MGIYQAGFGRLTGGVDGARHAALCHGLHAAACRALRLPAERFVFLTGAAGRGTLTAAGLTALADAVPGPAGVAPLPRRGAPSLAGGYRRLLAALAPETDAGLRGLLGPSWRDWTRMRDAAPAGVSQSVLFARWSAALPQPLQRRARAAFAAAADPLDRVRDAANAADAATPLLRPCGALWTAPVYEGVSDAAAGAAHLRPGGMFEFDSEAQRPSPRPGAVISVAAPGRAAYVPRLASSELQARFAGAPLRVHGRVGAHGLAALRPGAWFDATTVAAARAAGPDAPIWDGWSPAGRWGSFFGPRGALRRRTTHAVIVGDADLVIESRARFSRGEVAEIDRALAGGIWPFMATEGTPVRAARAHRTGRGHLRVDWRVPRGAAQCWGILIGPP